MKALKLIIIAIVMAGALAGLMFLSLGSDSEEKTTPEQEALYSKLKTRIDEHWSSGNWSLSQFNSDYIMLNKQKGELGRQYYTSLSDQLNTLGNKALYHDLKAAYARPACKKTDIVPLMEDMDRFLQKAHGFDKDKLVKEMQSTYTLYNQVLALATANFNRTPSFSMANNSFSPSFRTFKNNQLKLVNDLKNNDYFDNIKNIDEVKETLDSVPSRLDKAEGNFKNNLAQQIITAYQAEHPQQLSNDSLIDHRKRFGEIRKAFNQEFEQRTHEKIEGYLDGLPIPSNN